jgi:hypothetical protein
MRPKLTPLEIPWGALNPGGIILECNYAAEHRGIISNGVNNYLQPYLGSTKIVFKKPGWIYLSVIPKP